MLSVHVIILYVYVCSEKIITITHHLTATLFCVCMVRTFKIFSLSKLQILDIAGLVPDHHNKVNITIK